MPSQPSAVGRRPGCAHCKAGQEQDLRRSSGGWQDRTRVCVGLSTGQWFTKSRGDLLAKWMSRLMDVTALWKLISEVTSTFPVFLVRSKSQASPMPKGEGCTDVNSGGRTLGALKSPSHTGVRCHGGRGRRLRLRRAAPDTGQWW